MTSDYNIYAADPELRITARKQAEAFIRDQTQYHLGFLPTEQPHPYTRDFSQTVQSDPAEGVRVLLSVDRDLPPVARRTFFTAEFDELVDAFGDAIRSTGRVCFSGCGSTGRLAILLEEMWREFWEDRAGVQPGDAHRSPPSGSPERRKALEYAERACSIITGGDRALIRSVENFEDYAPFGARQVADLDLREGDVLVAISEGGETSSVLGTITEGLARGCRVFFIYNNPTDRLTRYIERSKRIIEDERVTVIDLYSGPMALPGSTRRHATTLEMVVAGAAMEEALRTAVEPGFKPDRQEVANSFATLLHSLQEPENLRVLGELAVLEADLYRAGGRITYFARKYLLDIFCDTTERTPTFMLPPFKRSDDPDGRPSWAYAKDPDHSGYDAWLTMLRRTPRGLAWSADDYRSMNANEQLIDQPPILDNNEIYRYHIGSEDDRSRYEGAPSVFLSFDVSADQSTFSMVTTTTYTIKPALTPSAINLFHHIAVKLVFNTISTASMGILGRIRNNWMVQVDPTNKKLIDRGSRIIAQIVGIEYEPACTELHLSLLARQVALSKGIESTTSPVVAALERLQGTGSI